MGFKLGKENRKFGDDRKNRFDKDDASVPGVPVIRKKLPEGVEAEANMDGTIFLSDRVKPGSAYERRILMHEMKHIVDMKTGKLSYDDKCVYWLGEKHRRAGGMIEYNNEWYKEGDENLPWEKH